MNTLIRALSAEDNKFYCFEYCGKWWIIRHKMLYAQSDRPAMAFALLRSYLAYGKSVKR